MVGPPDARKRACPVRGGLGGNRTVQAVYGALVLLHWFASGNNLQFKGDTARRVVPMDIDAQMERPEERTGFAYPRLLDHVRYTRPTLVWAALTIVQAYFQAGTPAQKLSAYGSFQEWSDLIRSAVVWSCDADPCEGRKNLEAESDPAFDRLATLLDCWHACYQDNTVTLVRALQDISLWAQPIDANYPANQWHALQDALSAFDPTYRGQRLNAQLIGTAMSRIASRIIDSKRFIRGNKRTETGYTWRVESLSIPVTAVTNVTNSHTPLESVREEEESQGKTTEAESLTVSGIALANVTAVTAVTGDTATPTAAHPDREVFNV